MNSTAIQFAELRDTVLVYRKMLADRGLSTLEFLEQFSYLLVMKLAAEQYAADLSGDAEPHAARMWDALKNKRGAELETQYRYALKELPKATGTTAATIYRSAENRISDPAILEQLVTELIAPRQWLLMGADVLGALYEDFLAQSLGENTEAGNFLTPRALVRTVVEVMDPRPDDVIVDPACGSAGFLIAAYRHILDNYTADASKEQIARLGAGAIRGAEIKASRGCIASMNMLLHGLGAIDGEGLISVGDILEAKPDAHASMVFVNPPFGTVSRKPGVDDIDSGEGKSYERDDFIKTTSTHLNFLQHTLSLLAIGGRAAVVVPDNVLFGSGAADRIRTKLLATTDMHTLLRLPTGIFFKGGVKTSVLFFDKKSPRADGAPLTTEMWVYDFRTGKQFSNKNSPMTYQDLTDFIARFKAGDRSYRQETDRFRRFRYSKLAERQFNLDIRWQVGEKVGIDIRQPAQIAREIAEDLGLAAAEFLAIADSLEAIDGAL
ncbi:HsdM family class I SAM-dependent methyltransferase [Nocardia sp. CA-129566]|uniref:HsdM family class I SAM-dependent methyltransferase n=1 Tax=Nocardia sp. CA-129566 TaxID=3239976 RepID=UPI003D96D24E